MSVLYLKCLGGFCVCSSGEYALKKVSPGLRVSDVETLSLQKSAKNGKKNPQKTRHRRLFCVPGNNSLRSDRWIFLSNADSCQLRVSKHPANAIRVKLFSELVIAGLQGKYQKQ